MRQAMEIPHTTNAGQRPALPGDIVGPCSTQRSSVARRSLFSRSRSEFLTLPQFLSSSTRKEEESEAGKEPGLPNLPKPQQVWKAAFLQPILTLHPKPPRRVLRFVHARLESP